MKRFSFILTIATALCVATACSQPPASVPIVGMLGRFIGVRSEADYSYASFRLVKDFSDTTFKDTVVVRYQTGTVNIPIPETVALQLQACTDNEERMFRFADDDPDRSLQAAAVAEITADHWENCETGRKPCPVLTFERPGRGVRWFLLMPCGGTQTDIAVRKVDGSWSADLHLFHANCPPVVELTTLSDGHCTASMRACGLGGTVSFDLITGAE